MTTPASWYHLSVKTMGRSAGRSVVAAAAYRLGERLHEQEVDQTHDYRRRGGVVTTFTVAPSDAPGWAHDPERLWNAANAAEKRKNSQLARECELALPASLSAAEREEVVRAYAGDLVDRYGVAVTVAIHEPSRHGDERNHHAHILMTTRRMTEDGLGQKTRVLDDRKTGPGEVFWMREHAADLINTALEKAGLDERVDHRSFQDRGIEREPTTHLGPTATDMERRGEGSERGDANREAQERNRSLDELVAEYAAIEAAIVAEEERQLDQQYGPADPDLSDLDDLEIVDGRWVRAQTPDLPTTVRDAAAEEAAQVEADAAPFVALIQRTGEIPQGGLAVPWWEQTALLADRFFDNVRQLIAGVWQSLIERGR